MEKQNSSSRRRFLKLTGAGSLGTMVGVSGCLGGGDGDSGGDGGSETTPTGASGGDGGSTPTSGDGGSSGSSSGDASVREEYGLPELDYELEDTLTVFQWADYWPLSEDFNTIQVFEDAYGVSVNVSNYASNEEMFNKLNAGGSGQFDVVFPSDYMVNILADQEMIRPLDLEKIPNWSNLANRWREQAPYDPGEERYSAPYFWGTSGIGWNGNMLADDTEYPLASWDALWDETYSGQITMLDDMRETIGASLKRLGYSLNSEDESEIEEAKQALIEQKDLLLTYDSVNMAENLINENASPIHTWSGSAFSAYWQLYEDDASPIGYQVPEEGGVVWVDTATVTADAQHPNAAHAFINYVLAAQVNGAIANYVYYPSPNEAAKEYITDSMLENERIYPPEETMQKLEFIRNLGQATSIWSEAWTEIQNA